MLRKIIIATQMIGGRTLIRRDVGGGNLGGGHLANSWHWLISVHRQISVCLILFFTHKSEYYRNFCFNIR